MSITVAVMVGFASGVLAFGACVALVGWWADRDIQPCPMCQEVTFLAEDDDGMKICEACRSRRRGPRLEVVA